MLIGSSGFIGTNLVNFFLKKNIFSDILCIDKCDPKDISHNSIFKKINVLDESKMSDIVDKFLPTHIIYLSARTDLNGKTLKDYEFNFKGVETLLKITSFIPDLKIIFFSSMLASIKLQNRFSKKSPNVIYGRSKFLGEELINKCSSRANFVILRPTSIWGPWFGSPYKDFFIYIKRGIYFNFSNLSTFKSFGYIETVCRQTETAMFDSKYQKGIWYVGNSKPINIKEFSNKISIEMNCKKIKEFHSFIFFKMALFGELLNLFKINFPMRLSRYKNIKDPIIIEDNLFVSDKIEEDYDAAIKDTVRWLNRQEIHD